MGLQEWRKAVLGREGLKKHWSVQGNGQVEAGAGDKACDPARQGTSRLQVNAVTELLKTLSQAASVPVREQQQGSL